MAERHEIKGLDTLRFVAASIVALGNGAAFPLADEIGKHGAWQRVLTGVWGVSFNGVAAVIVFFVISGFCIHYGPATGAPYRTGPFWVRRGVRIAGPLLGAMALATALGHRAEGALGAVLWSLYCELIYYALYPLLRIAFRRLGLANTVLISLLVAGAMIVVGWRLPYYWSFTIWLTWLVGLPAWLLGCLLAEQVAAIGVAGAGNVWAWRAGLWTYATVALAVFFHAPIKAGLPLLLFPFQLLIYLWIMAEMNHFERRGTSRLLEWCGRWSYSLYLVHNIVISATPISPTALVTGWMLRVALILGGSLAFYAVVEAPSHWLARTASRRLTSSLAGRRPAGAQLAVP
ncbi:MAG TPA: acyltransferase [Caulobacteraceae bacterium]|jgi:peptidoglycan/LPS O-acetylase OafA/YrhL